MLTSFAANSRWLYRASKAGNVEMMSAVMFFSTDADALGRFYSSFLEKDLSPYSRSNMKIFQGKVVQSDKYRYYYDRTMYAEELLAIVLDFLSDSIELFKMLDKYLGANKHQL